MSAATVGLAAWKLSGGAYSGVSASRLTDCSPLAAMIEASPKSASPTTPYGLIKMFPGLISRCKIPAACAAARASARSAPIRQASPGLIGPLRRNSSLSEPAGHNSITRYGRPSPSVPAS
jgi:hypothetical protein